MDKIGSGIWQVSGPDTGPVLTILGGVHGDERTGIEAVKELSALFDSRKENLTSGTLVLVLGNEEAIRLKRRGTSVTNDLNRMFSRPQLAGPVLDSYESGRAHELAPLLRTTDISIDIHSTSTPSRPFLPCAFSPRHERIFRWFDADIVLTDPDYILGGECSTTDEYVDSCGGTGICFETGYAGDTSRLPLVLAGIRNILADQGMIVPPPPHPPPPHYSVYRLARKIILTESGFRYAGGFPGSFQPVQEGETIGYHGNQPEIAGEEGVIVFPKAPGQWHTGQDIFFLARKVR